MSAPASIFLSHSHKDKPFVRRLSVDLQAQGVRVWMDEAEMLIGDSLVQKIGEALEEMDFIGAVLSVNSVNSPWVTRELDIAINHEIAGRRVKVLPLVVDDCAMPAFLTDKIYGDFKDQSGYASALEHLMKRLRATGSSAPPDAAATASGPKLQASGLLKTPAAFEIRLLTALDNMRPLAADFSSGDNAYAFLDALATFGDLIRTSTTALLPYGSTKPFLEAYNSLAAISGQETTVSPEEARQVVFTLLLRVDDLSIDIGVQALRLSLPADREKAARVLGRFGPTAQTAVGALRKALRDPSGPVRTAAAWALAAIGTEEAQRAIADYERS